MAVGKKLNEAEIKTVLKLKEQFSISKIAGIINRNRKFTYNLLKNVDNYDRKEKFLHSLVYVKNVLFHELRQTLVTRHVKLLKSLVWKQIQETFVVHSLAIHKYKIYAT